MSELKSQIDEAIKEKRPQIAASSRRTYVSLLSNCLKRLDADDLKFITKNKKDVLEYVDKMTSAQTQKTLLSCLFILTDDTDYRDKMITYASKVNEHYRELKTDPKRLENLPTMDVLREKYTRALDTVKKNPTFENYVMYFTIALTSGIVCPPRRNDIREIKLKNINKETDNYVAKGCIIYNKFKTAKFKDEAQRTVEIKDAEFWKVLTKWKKVNESDYLIPNLQTGGEYTSSSFTKLLNRIYGANIGVDALRSVFLTDLYKGLNVNKLEQIADQMGNSVNSQLNFYVKND